MLIPAAVGGIGTSTGEGWKCAVGCMPLTKVVVGVFPAYEYASWLSLTHGCFWPLHCMIEAKEGPAIMVLSSSASTGRALDQGAPCLRYKYSTQVLHKCS